MKKYYLYITTSYYPGSAHCSQDCKGSFDSLEEAKKEGEKYKEWYITDEDGKVIPVDSGR